MRDIRRLIRSRKYGGVEALGACTQIGAKWARLRWPAAYRAGRYGVMRSQGSSHSDPSLCPLAPCARLLHRAPADEVHNR